MKVTGIDLALPFDKEPAALADSLTGILNTDRAYIGAPYAIGSSHPDQKVCYKSDLGLFPCVHEARKNHWNLRTSPEDWWFTVTCHIAKVLDKEAKKGNKDVRELFVDHEGQRELCVDVDVFTIYEVDYESFFSTMASKITSEIKVPEYATAMQPDFSTTTTTHRIASQINLMASMQEFFSFNMGMCGCGIKAVEMLGEQEDWNRLVVKLRQLRKQLEPILPSLWALRSGWLDHVEFVFRKLAETYAVSKSSGGSKPMFESKVFNIFPAFLNMKGKRAEVNNFWADIFMVGDGWKYGPSGPGGYKAEEYNGWLVEFLTGSKSILVEDFLSETNKELLKGLNSVPMKVTLKYKQPPVSDEAQLMAGIMGFEVYPEQDTFNSVPSLQPHHMWAMTLPSNSPLRE